MKAPRVRNWLRTLIKSAIAVSLMLAMLAVVAELVLRFVGFGKLEIYEPDRLLFWRLKPGQNCFTKINRQPVHINSQGTRGPEFPPSKPIGTFRVLMLGDSRTFGWGLAEAETYSGLVESALQARAGASRKVEVINAGVNAWSYPQLSLFFRERALAWQPDAVVIGDANLWTQFSTRSSPEFVERFMSRVRLKNLLRRSALYHFLIEVQLEAFYQRHRTKFIPVDPKSDTLFKEQQQSDPDALFRDAITEICKTATRNRIVPILLYLPTQDELLAGKPNHNVRLVKRAAAEEFGLQLVDLTGDLTARVNEVYLPADPVHHNAEGNRIIARRLVEVLQPLIDH